MCQKNVDLPYELNIQYFSFAVAQIFVFSHDDFKFF